MSKLEAHYSANGLIGRMIVLSGVAAAFVGFGFLGLYERPNWFAPLVYAIIATLVAMSLTSLYRLLTQKGQVIVSIDAVGFKDIRITPTVIPWSAIVSLSPSIDVKSKKTIGAALVIDSAFQRRLAIRLGAKLNNWANLFFGLTLYVDTRCLDVDYDELSRDLLKSLTFRNRPERRAELDRSISIRSVRSGRIEARSGLRMMPTFPRSPLSFRTAGFPRYGWKAGFSDGAFPASTRA